MKLFASIFSQIIKKSAANATTKMIFPRMHRHWNLIDPINWTWTNFTAKELACPHCGEIYYDPYAFDCLQKARDLVGEAFHINSAHRCWFHNQLVGGVINSMHKKQAFDISVLNHYRDDLAKACQEAGFNAFGYYQTFLHVDTRAYKAQWDNGEKARQLWRLS